MSDKLEDVTDLPVEYYVEYFSYETGTRVILVVTDIVQMDGNSFKAFHSIAGKDFFIDMEYGDEIVIMRAKKMPHKETARYDFGS